MITQSISLSIALSMLPDSSSRAFTILLSSKPISFISAIWLLYSTEGSIFGYSIFGGAGGGVGGAGEAGGNTILAPVYFKKGLSWFSFLKPNSKVCCGLAPKIRLSYLSYFSFSLINRLAYIKAYNPESSLTSLFSFFFSSLSALLANLDSKCNFIYFSIFALALWISDLVNPKPPSSTNSIISSKIYICCYDSQYFEKLAK